MGLINKEAYVGFIFSFILLSSGGMFNFLANFHLSNLFPNNKALILSILNGAFCISAYIFLLFSLIFEKTPLLTRRNMFLFLSFIMIFMMAISVFFSPFQGKLFNF